MVQLDVRVVIIRMHREADGLHLEPTGDQEVFNSLRFSQSPCYHSHYVYMSPSPSIV